MAATAGYQRAFFPLSSSSHNPAKNQIDFGLVLSSTLARFFFLAMLCVLWWGALDRLWLRAAQSVRVCSTTGYITSGLRGPSPQAITLFGGVGFIARRPEKGNADGVRGIFGTAYRVGLRPCDRTHLKNGLVPYSYAGGA